MTSLPGMKKNNILWSPNTSFWFLTFSFINKRWTFISANKQFSRRRIIQKCQEWVSFSIFTCNIGQFTQLLKFWLSFSVVLLWKWNSNYSEIIQCQELLRKTAETCQFMTNIQNTLVMWLMTSCPSVGLEKIISKNITFPQIFSAEW